MKLSFQIFLLAALITFTASKTKPASCFSFSSSGKPNFSESKKNKIKLNQNDRILFLGNSITKGAQFEIDYLKNKLKIKYPKLFKDQDSLKFILSGISGEQAYQGNDRVNDLIETYKPNICVINYGTCEVTFKNTDSFIPAMQEIINKLKKHKIKIIIVSPPPCSVNNWMQPAEWTAEQFINGLPNVAELAKKIARNNNLIFIDSFNNLLNYQKSNKHELTTDGIHLNELGYQLLAENLMEAWSSKL